MLKCTWVGVGEGYIDEVIGKMEVNSIMRLVLLAVLIAGSAVSDIINNGCSPGWYQNGNFCYLFNAQKQVTQQQATDECDVFMATLLRIESSDELTFIGNTVPKFTSDGFWTDMSQRRYDGTGTATGVWQWGGYEPVDMSMITWESYPTQNNIDSCGAVNIQGYFQNWNCDRRLGYICEATQTQNSGCFEGWMITDNACFWFSNTSDPTQLLSWNDAKARCAAFPLPPGATGTLKLVTLDSSTDSAYITGEMPEVVKTTTMFWTGLKKIGNNWAWYNGDTYNAGYLSWAQEPDKINNNEWCATIKTDGKFSDQDCSKQMNYICRIQTSQVNTDYYMGCNGWQRGGHKCYMFYDSPASTWADANTHCNSIGSRLLKIENLDEKNWLEWQLTDESHSHVYWSGLNDRASEGVYLWADGSSSNNSFIKWNSEPNSYRGDEDCAALRNDGTYNDDDCYLHIPAICEYTNPASAQTCPSGWVAYTANHGCYYITPNNQTYTWDEAHTYCTKTMAQDSTVPTTLLAVNNVNEMNFINSQLANIQHNPRGYWTGLNDQKTEGIWVFPEPFNNPVNANILIWNKEPFDPTGTKDCALLLWGGHYVTGNCDTKLGFICENYATVKNTTTTSAPGITKAYHAHGNGNDRLTVSSVVMYLSVLLIRLVL